MLSKSLAKFFSPKSIAIVGVSGDARKVGSTILTNLLASGYAGKLFPVNPKYKELFNLECFNSINKIPHRIDLVVLAIPAPFILNILKECAAKKVKNVIIVSAGFKETGAEGAKLEEQIQTYCNANEISLIGVNSLGLIASEDKVNASFSALNAKQGDIALMSQSGAICTAILDLASLEGLGFSHVVSLGNKTNINENDLLNYWLVSDKVNVIAAYIEEFTDGFNFVNLKEKLKVEKPIIVLHPGNSDQAAAAMALHTGSMAGSTKIINAALDRYGITRVENLTEFYGVQKLFSWGKMPTGRKVAVVTNAGGVGIVATDTVVKHGLQLAKIDENLQAALKEVLPSSASTHNPIDIIGDAPAERYQAALSLVCSSPEVDAVLVILTPQLVTQIEETAKAIISIAKDSAKLIVPVFIGGRYVNAGLTRLHDNEIPAFTDLETAASCISKVIDYSEYKAASAQKITIANVQKKPKYALPSHEELTTLADGVTHKLLAEFDIKTPGEQIIRSWEEAQEFATKFGYPIVLKALASNLLHKTELNAVELNINSPEMLKEKLTKLQEKMYKLTKQEHPPVLIQQQIAAGLELFMGVKRDGDSNVYKDGIGFGHLLLFGSGGIYTEVYGDVAAGFLPLEKAQLQLLITKTKVAKILNGARGKEAYPTDQLIATLQKLQEMVITYPKIVELDCNPVIITNKECYIVDAKILIKD